MLHINYSFTIISEIKMRDRIKNVTIKLRTLISKFGMFPAASSQGENEFRLIWE